MYRRCSPVKCMLLLKEVVIDLYVVVASWSFFIKVVTVLNLTVPSDATGYEITFPYMISLYIYWFDTCRGILIIKACIRGDF